MDIGANPWELLTRRGRTCSLTRQPTVYLLYCRSHFSNLVSWKCRCWIRHQVEQRNCTAPMIEWQVRLALSVGQSVRWFFIYVNRECNAFNPGIAISKFERGLFCQPSTIRPPYSSRVRKKKCAILHFARMCSLSLSLSHVMNTIAQRIIFFESRESRGS